MASECNSIFESDIVVNPCKNWRMAPRDKYVDDNDRQNAAKASNKGSMADQSEPDMIGVMMKDTLDESSKHDKFESLSQYESADEKHQDRAEMDRIAHEHKDEYLAQPRSGDDGVGKEASEEPVEPAEPKASAPAFFPHRYENGKRSYKSFACNGCTKVVRADKLKIKGIWKCHECVRPQSSVARDKHRHRKVSALG